ncbi:MAG: AGE family epimerase/isomerase [Pseudomonadota bacterium]
MIKVYPVIMCGGVGSRLWPRSRVVRPKQFAPMFNTRSLFQLTAERCRDLTGLQILTIVTSAAYADVVRRQMDGIDLPYKLLLEPSGRDSAPAVACAVEQLSRIDAEGTIVLLSADHHVPDAKHFVRDTDRAVASSQDGSIVLLGITPDEPSSAYGYLQPDYGDDGPSSDGQIVPVSEFREKPDTETARDYIARSYLWNSGNFFAPVRTLQKEFATHATDIAQLAAHAVDEAVVLDDGIAMGERFLDMQKISIDYAIMEKTSHAKVLPSRMIWSDLGAWDAVRDSLSQDADGNAAEGDAILHDSERCLVHCNDDRLVVGLGLRDIGIVVEKDTVLVLDLNASQGVKNVVSDLKARERREADTWGRSGFDAREFVARMARWLPSTALSLWTSLGFDHDSGLWREAIDQDGRPLDGPVRNRVQGRQSALLGAAVRDGWQGPWQPILPRAFEAAAKAYGTSGDIQATLLAADGTIADPDEKLYDQTFRLLALAQLPHETAVEIQAADRARAVLGAIRARFGAGPDAPLDTLRETGAEPFATNPVMHLFEACLEWVETAPDDDDWRHHCTVLSSLATERLFDDADPYIREYYGEGWVRREDEAGHIVDPGHQFEWAWLLARWAKLCGEDRPLAVARKLHETGLAGIDAATGSVPLWVNTGTGAQATQRRFWSQLERVKASLLMLEGASPADVTHYLTDTVAGLSIMEAYLDTPVPGLWFDRMRSDGTFEEGPAPASTFYHIASAIRQIVASTPTLLAALDESAKEAAT